MSNVPDVVIDVDFHLGEIGGDFDAETVTPAGLAVAFLLMARNLVEAPSGIDFLLYNDGVVRIE